MTQTDTSKYGGVFQAHKLLARNCSGSVSSDV